VKTNTTKVTLVQREKLHKNTKNKSKSTLFASKQHNRLRLQISSIFDTTTFLDLQKRELNSKCHIISH